LSHIRRSSGHIVGVTVMQLPVDIVVSDTIMLLLILVLLLLVTRQNWLPRTKQRHVLVEQIYERFRIQNQQNSDNEDRLSFGMHEMDEMTGVQKPRGWWRQKAELPG